MKIQAGTHDYTLEIPRFVPKYPHSQAMPVHMPEVIPFRYCEILPGKEQIVLGEARQLALWYEFDDHAAEFVSSSKALNDVYALCHYSLKVNTFNGDYASSERERMMYEADTYIQQMGHYAVTGSLLSPVTVWKYVLPHDLAHGMDLARSPYGMGRLPAHRQHQTHLPLL